MQKESKYTSSRAEDNFSPLFFPALPINGVTGKVKSYLPHAPSHTVRQLILFLSRGSTSSMLWTRFAMFLHFRGPAAAIPHQHEMNQDSKVL